MNKRVLVTGANGCLGNSVVKSLSKKGYHYYPFSKDYLDVTDKKCVENVFDKIRPLAVIHCGAYTNVDLAETERAKVYSVNAKGTENIALSCKRINAEMIHISTNFIFDGNKKGEYKESDTNYNPLNNYGASKLLSEEIVEDVLTNYFIVRTEWVFGLKKDNFVNNIIKKCNLKKEFGVVCDQIGRPTYSEDLASLLVDMIGSDKYGIYHATNSGKYISKYDFALLISDLIKSDCKINKVFTEKTIDSNVAKRPLNGKLNTDSIVKNGFNALPDYKDALKRYIQELRINGI